LAPVAKRPFLEYVLDRLAAAGIRRLILCVGYKRAQVELWAQSQLSRFEIAISVEEEPLGTAGALRHAEDLIDHEFFFAINGDSIVDVDVRSLSAFHCRQQAVATITLVPAPGVPRYGTVDLDDNSRVIFFGEKASNDQVESSYISAGFYVFDHRILRDIPAQKVVSLERDIFPNLVERREMAGFVTSGFFIDIGVPEDYCRAEIELQRYFSA
jgi:NDP-sugar pyrophosphorylase family protein